MVLGRFSRSSLVTISTAPVRLIFFCSPKPTTTTSSSCWVSSERIILSLVLSPKTISRLSKPMELNTKTCPGSACRVNWPKASVTVPVEVPLISTVTPGRVSLEIASYTVPV